ncbi:uncharacterized protein LOC109503260 [Felis catus]|uniref:uncharacterized protein LOC109503260 n=1 Tax=Felis catus TaxID=9685 RepID=UPI001D1A2626|nr:uncharacterized protein LOC109503260 [Felis catus]
MRTPCCARLSPRSLAAGCLPGPPGFSEVALTRPRGPAGKRCILVAGGGLSEPVGGRWLVALRAGLPRPVTHAGCAVAAPLPRAPAPVAPGRQHDTVCFLLVPSRGVASGQALPSQAAPLSPPVVAGNGRDAAASRRGRPTARHVRQRHPPIWAPDTPARKNETPKPRQVHLCKVQSASSNGICRLPRGESRRKAQQWGSLSTRQVQGRRPQKTAPASEPSQ